MRRLGGCRHQLFSKRSVGTASDIPKAFEILIALPHQFGVLRDDKIGTAAEAEVMGSEGRRWTIVRRRGRASIRCRITGRCGNTWAVELTQVDVRKTAKQRWLGIELLLRCKEHGGAQRAEHSGAFTTRASDQM